MVDGHARPRLTTINFTPFLKNVIVLTEMHRALIVFSVPGHVLWIRPSSLISQLGVLNAMWPHLLGLLLDHITPFSAVNFQIDGKNARTYEARPNHFSSKWNEARFFKKNELLSFPRGESINRLSYMFLHQSGCQYKKRLHKDWKYHFGSELLSWVFRKQSEKGIK